MSTQKKVWIGALVLVGLALLAVPLTANANRQRTMEKPGPLTDAQQQRAQAAADARWQGLATQQRRENGENALPPLPVHDATGAMLTALAPKATYRNSEPARATAYPVYDATGAMLTALAPQAEPRMDWRATEAQMTALPGYYPNGPWPAAGPDPNGTDR